MDTDKRKTIELRDMSVKTLKTEKEIGRGEEKTNKKGTEYSKTENHKRYNKCAMGLPEKGEEKNTGRVFPGDPVVRTLHFYCWRAQV